MNDSKPGSLLSEESLQRMREALGRIGAERMRQSELLRVAVGKAFAETYRRGVEWTAR